MRLPYPALPRCSSDTLRFRRKPLAVLAAAMLALHPVQTGANPAPSDIVASHVLPGYAALAQRAAALDAAAQADCAPDSPALRAAWAEAVDAWIAVSHLRFGPSEEEDRAFALAFWPDSRGMTPKSLRGLIAAEDPVINTPAEFAEVSIAARGFYALEFLLFDAGFADQNTYGCALTRAIAHDIAGISAAILADWEGGFADAFSAEALNGNAPEGARYHSEEEALQELFKAVTTGLQFTSDARLGRPLGSYDKPRPNRAEARRSERSLRHVRLSLEATQDLALSLAADAPDVADALDKAYAATFEQVTAQDSPVFAGVTDPMGRFRVEMLQRAIENLRTVIATELGPELGVASGFNALDGD